MFHAALIDHLRWYLVIIWFVVIVLWVSFMLAVPLRGRLYAYGVITNLRVATVIPKRHLFFFQPSVESAFFKHNFGLLARGKLTQRTSEQGHEERLESILKVIYNKENTNVGKVVAYGSPPIQLHCMEDIKTIENTLTHIIQTIITETNFQHPTFEVSRVEKFKNDKTRKLKLKIVMMKYVLPAITTVLMWSQIFYVVDSIQEDIEFEDILGLVILFTCPFLLFTSFIVLVRSMQENLDSVLEQRSIQIGYFPELDETTSLSP